MHQMTKKSSSEPVFLRQLKNFYVKCNLLLQFYTATSESRVNPDISVRHASLDSHSHSNQSINQSIILPSVKSSDPSHPDPYHFQLMSSRRRYRSISTNTSCLKTIFFPHCKKDFCLLTTITDIYSVPAL